MKNVSQILTLAILFALAISCGSNSQEEKAATVAQQEKKLDINASRGYQGSKQAIARFSLEGLNINVEEMDLLELQTAAAAEAAEEDAMKLARLNEKFLTADKEAQVLDVNFSMSDEPVENGMFVFSIESPDNKSITLEMFDEESYRAAAHTAFLVNEGNNYKALNVNTLDSGDYLFRLKDDQGRELARTVSIDHKGQY